MYGLNSSKNRSFDLFISTGFHEKEDVDFLNETIAHAVEKRVHDIHFQQTEDECRIRFRMPGGEMYVYATISAETMLVIDDKIRSKAKLSTTDRMHAQDGRIGLRFNELRIDMRVAITPGVDGQLIVCRLLNQSNSNLDSIEMTSAVRESFERLILEPNGLFLVTGPTGSGKTTTLYSLLNELNDGSKNIITIENPVEYRIKDFHQINVDGDAMTFADALRSALRQDPDVIMVGEIRDHETMQIALQAAITGHLVLSTLHANNAAAAITRLVDLGADPHTLAAALRGISAQRLIRTVNESHSSYLPPTEMDKIWLRANNIHRDEGVSYPIAESPEDFAGSIPVMEIIIADHRVKKTFELSEAEIYAAASRQPQFETLAQAAERLALAGRTTLGEAKRLTPVQEAPAITNRRLGQVLVDFKIVSSSDMENLLNLQSELRKSGDHQRLGRLLINQGYCSPEELIDAVGYTSEAYDVLAGICRTSDRQLALQSIKSKWIPGVDSLFDIAVSMGVVREDELTNANSF